MVTLVFLEEEERFSQFELKLESVELSVFSKKPGLEIEPELEFRIRILYCTIFADFPETFIL